MVDDGSGRSEEGEQGGTETPGTGESVQDGTRSSDGGGRVERAGSTGTETGGTKTREGETVEENHKEQELSFNNSSARHDKSLLFTVYGLEVQRVRNNLRLSLQPLIKNNQAKGLRHLRMMN